MASNSVAPASIRIAFVRSIGPAPRQKSDLRLRYDEQQTP